MAFDYDVTKEITFYKACPQGKQHRTKLSCSSRRADESLGLAYSNVYAIMNDK